MDVDGCTYVKERGKRAVTTRPRHRRSVPSAGLIDGSVHHTFTGIEYTEPQVFQVREVAGEFLPIVP